MTATTPEAWEGLHARKPYYNGVTVYGRAGYNAPTKLYAVRDGRLVGYYYAKFNSGAKPDNYNRIKYAEVMGKQITEVAKGDRSLYNTWLHLIKTMP